MKELIEKINYLLQEVERLKSLETGTGGGGGGGVTSVSVTSPIVDTGTATVPNIGLGITPVTSVTGTSPIASSGGATPAISLGNSGVTAGSYTSANITVDAHGLVSAASNGAGGGGGVTTASQPLAITGSNIAITATAGNDGGTIVKNPAFTQTAFIQISGSISSGSVSTGAVSASSVTSTGAYKYGSVTVIERGSTFPTTGLVDGYRYYHTIYRAWFVYNSTDALWRQEAPGVFSGSFPTVAVGDNTVTPNIEVKRLDRSNRVYYWDGTRWLSVTIYKQPYISRSNQPFAAGTITFDTSLVDYALGSGTYISKISLEFLPLTAQSTVNFYTVTTGIVDTSGALTNITLMGNDNTKAFTSSGSWKPLIPTFTPVAFGTTAGMLFVQMAPTGSPGSFYMNVTVEYQEVG